MHEHHSSDVFDAVDIEASQASQGQGALEVLAGEERDQLRDELAVRSLLYRMKHLDRQHARLTEIRESIVLPYVEAIGAITSEQERIRSSLLAFLTTIMDDKGKASVSFPDIGRVNLTTRAARVAISDETVLLAQLAARDIEVPVKTTVDQVAVRKLVEEFAAAHEGEILDGAVVEPPQVAVAVRLT